MKIGVPVKLKSRGSSLWNGRRWKRGLRKTRNLLIGSEINNGLVFKLFLYAIFIVTSYIYMNPIMRMVVKMVMDVKDLLDPTVTWIPSSIYLGHIETAWHLLKYNKTVLISLVVSTTVAVFHCFSCGLAGYALARLEVPMKRLVTFLLIIAFVIPPQVIVLPTIVAYSELNLSNSLITLVIPALFGFGMKGAMFVIIYRQFFMTQPKELEEAAKIDGASVFRFYRKVMIPLSKPAMLVVFLFSFVWTWNDTYLPRMYLTAAENVPLAVEMSRLGGSVGEFIIKYDLPLYMAEPIRMAASFLTILPPLLLYMFAQRYFTESVERTGLVE
ncbi:carbohydrate ABC transporter permease [Paenibacillus sp. J5C_2022]|uniref:carbohydrate ABC transporter permease n=1 Tax=Paenibacillus sp. J5C2022 TaxID=2977129 RepID=UPI0021CDF8FA|nr:carbohydrate ABC transporter permease [Paenibacillus sp. J5C2022]MCU6708843.1 carbohydrate ABC transporter permease [Paenibacillus sp. J5C2022]